MGVCDFINQIYQDFLLSLNQMKQSINSNEGDKNANSIHRNKIEVKKALKDIIEMHTDYLS